MMATTALGAQKRKLEQEIARVTRAMSYAVPKQSVEAWDPTPAPVPRAARLYGWDHKGHGKGKLDPLPEASEGEESLSPDEGIDGADAGDGGDAQPGSGEAYAASVESAYIRMCGMGDGSDSECQQSFFRAMCIGMDAHLRCQQRQQLCALETAAAVQSIASDVHVMQTAQSSARRRTPRAAKSRRQ